MLPNEVHQAFANSYVSVGACRLKLYELSHRHPVAIDRVQEILRQLRHLLAIPEGYEVLLCSGGARHQYELVASNFAKHKREIGLSGAWSRVWYETMQSIKADRVNMQNLLEQDLSVFLNNQPRHEDLRCIVTNETVDGIMLPHPHEYQAGLIADVTSDLGFRFVPIDRYAMLFAATGKAFGVSGMTIVIIKKDFLQQAEQQQPVLQSYRAMAMHQSMYATPSLICIDMLGHIVAWMARCGGMSAIERRQKLRSDTLYKILDSREIYTVKVPKNLRSMHSICFDVCEHRQDFFVQAEDAGIYGLKGHKLVGGARISLTHGVSEQAFTRLCQFLNEF